MLPLVHTRIEFFGRPYRGRLAITRGLWQMGLCVNLGSFLVGVSIFSLRYPSFELDVGFFSVDVSRQQVWTHSR